MLLHYQGYDYELSCSKWIIPEKGDDVAPPL